MEQVEITADHLKTMRENYNCSNMTDEMIINAMLKYDEKFGSNRVSILDLLCFPSFQSLLDQEKLRVKR